MYFNEFDEHDYSSEYWELYYKDQLELEELILKDEEDMVCNLLD